jgi:hypothetical protein
LSLSVIAKRRATAELIATFPAFFSSLLSQLGDAPLEVLTVLDSLCRFPKYCGVATEFFSAERLLGIAQSVDVRPDILGLLMRIVFCYSRLPHLPEYVVAEIIAFLSFCLANHLDHNASYLLLDSVAAIVKGYDVLERIPSQHFAEVSNSFLMRCDKRAVRAALGFLVALLPQTHAHLATLNYARLMELLRAADADIQTAVLRFWHGWISLFGGFNTWLSQMVEDHGLAEKMATVVENGYFTAKILAVDCLSMLMRVVPAGAKVVTSRRFVDAVCEVLDGEKQPETLASAIELLSALVRTGKDVSGWIEAGLAQGAIPELLEADNLVVRQMVSDLYSQLCAASAGG